MYTVLQMKKAVLVMLLICSTFAWASEPLALSLPPVVHADTEVVTNVPLPVLSRRAAKFAFSLGCRATPTNNVEIALGTDTDSDGVLSPREMRLVVGWESGSWFVKRGFVGERQVAWSPSADEAKTLSWEMTLGLRAAPRRLVVREGTAPLPTGGACGCFSGNGNMVTFGCSPTCTCGGNCLAVGAFNFEHALFSVTGGVCRCGFDDPAPAEAPTYEPTAGASLAIAFSGPTVAFEGESGRASDALRTKKSTRVLLTVSAFGGPHGGTVTFTRTNFGKLRMVGSGGFELPSPLTLAAGQSFFASCVCEGVEASDSVNDIVVSGRFVEADTGTAITASANLTSCSVTFVTPTGDPAVRAEETDSGDGQNEFTFDDATQTLTIGLKVRIEPDITQLANLGTCSFVMPAISGSDLFWTDNGGDLGHPTPQSADVGALVQATARYVGYPPSNSDFGRKTVSFRVLGLTITNDFEVFFPSDGTHHPACSTCPGCQKL